MVERPGGREVDHVGSIDTTAVDVEALVAPLVHEEDDVPPIVRELRGDRPIRTTGDLPGRVARPADLANIELGQATAIGAEEDAVAILRERRVEVGEYVDHRRCFQHQRLVARLLHLAEQRGIAHGRR
jgi:hypothetical protein